MLLVLQLIQHLVGNLFNLKIMEREKLKAKLKEALALKNKEVSDTELEQLLDTFFKQKKEKKSNNSSLSGTLLDITETELKRLKNSILPKVLDNSPNDNLLDQIINELKKRLK